MSAAQSIRERCIALTVDGRQCRSEGKRRKDGEFICKIHWELLGRRDHAESKVESKVESTALDRAKRAIHESARRRWCERRGI